MVERRQHNRATEALGRDVADFVLAFWFANAMAVFHARITAETIMQTQGEILGGMYIGCILIGGMKATIRMADALTAWLWERGFR